MKHNWCNVADLRKNQIENNLDLTFINANLEITCFDEIYPDVDIEALYNKPWKSPRYCSFTVIKKQSFA
jgi:hypothetical protein